MATREATLNGMGGSVIKRQLPLLSQRMPTHLIPAEIRNHMHKVADRYAGDMLVQPNNTRIQRFIVEEGFTDLDKSITARLLLVAEFGRRKSSPSALIGGGIPAHVEDWMVTLLCERHEEGILLFAEELYVARTGGWERVYQLDHTKMGAKQQLTPDGAQWPQIDHPA